MGMTLTAQEQFEYWCGGNWYGPTSIDTAAKQIKPFNICKGSICQLHHFIKLSARIVIGGGVKITNFHQRKTSCMLFNKSIFYLTWIYEITAISQDQKRDQSSFISGTMHYLYTGMNIQYITLNIYFNDVSYNGLDKIKLYPYVSLSYSSNIYYFDGDTYWLIQVNKWQFLWEAYIMFCVGKCITPSLKGTLHMTV